MTKGDFERATSKQAQMMIDTVRKTIKDDIRKKLQSSSIVVTDAMVDKELETYMTMFKDGFVTGALWARSYMSELLI